MKNHHSWPPAWFAAKQDHLMILSFFAWFDAFDCHTCDNNGLTVTHIAAAYGSLDTLVWLHDNYEVNMSARAINGVTPLFCAAAEGQLDVVKFMIDPCDCSLNVADVDGQTPLRAAQINGHGEGCNFQARN